jgi:antagonist of KipI
MAGRWLPPDKRPAYSDHVIIPVILGPQAEAFSEDVLETFFSSEYAVSSTSDRMGYRLTGSQIKHQGSADWLSEAIPWGAVQVPADGQPIVMMADRPTTGGYTKIATVASAGMPLLAQAVPGWGYVHFAQTSVEEAQGSYRAMLSLLELGIEEDRDEWAY